MAAEPEDDGEGFPVEDEEVASDIPDDIHYSEQEDASSDEEYETNRIGDVPLEWYEDYDHVGYDIAGKKLEKAAGQGMDSIDKLIASKDDPMFRRTIFDEKNQESIVLTNRELNLVKRMVECKFVNETSTFNAEPEYNPYFSSKVMELPLNAAQEPKNRFLPSKWEKMKVVQMIRGIRAGVIKIEKDVPLENERYYLLWDDSDNVQDIEGDNLLENRKKRHIAAPKLTLPGHALSYHPPQEYLFNEEEEQKYDALPDEEKDRIVKPVDFKKMRSIPAYTNFIREQFERCLDLYLCTRVKKDRLTIDPESLVPKLPQPKELRPFPNVQAMSYYGHSAQVRSISVCHNGELLASGDAEGIVKIWEVETSKCLKTFDVAKILKIKEDRAISRVRFNPKFSLLAVSVSKFVLVFYIGSLLAGSDPIAAARNQELFFDKSNLDVKASDADALKEVKNKIAQAKSQEVDEEEKEEEDGDNEKVIKNQSRKLIEWSITGSVQLSKDAVLDSPERKQPHLKETFIKLEMLDPHVTSVTDLCWHPKGFYLVSVDNSTSRKRYGQVLIHHVAKKDSQRLFGATHPVSKTDVQRVCFHPNKPILFVATRQSVFCQDLMKKRLVKRLKAGTKWISSLAVHPSGDHLLVGGYDKRVNWFDLDLRDSPFKTMKFHAKAVRSVAIHPRYPLMATGSDEGAVHVFHARVFSDLMRNPLIVPVKNLNAHYVYADVGVFETVFHPTQPWLFTSGGDKNIHLFQNIP